MENRVKHINNEDQPRGQPSREQTNAQTAYTGLAQRFISLRFVPKHLEDRIGRVAAAGLTENKWGTCSKRVWNLYETCI